MNDILIPKWVPDSARERLAALLGHPNLKQAHRQLLARLAIYPAMRTGVWAKLPADPARRHGQIIDFAFALVTQFSAFVPRPGAKAKKAIWWRWVKILHDSPPGTRPDTAVLQAVSLLQSVCELRHIGDQYWARFWKGDHSLNLSKVADIIEQLALFYGRIAQEERKLNKRLPKIVRPYSEDAPRHFFVRAMSLWLERTYGRAFDEVTTALTEVAFDLTDGLDKENIRALRRSTKVAEKSRPRSS